MLSVSSYPTDYVAATRRRLEAELAAYDDLLVAAHDQSGAGHRKLDTAVARFEPLFFNHLVMALDNYFLHRGRAQEGKDGNPLNEVRVICKSLMDNDGRMTKDNTIKMDPRKTVLHYEVGDEIMISRDDFRALMKAFLAEIESRFPG